jgi:signal transduction histidine kinase
MRRWRRLIPATLFGQTVLILLAGLVFSTLIGILTLTFNQAAVVRAMGASAATQRIANLARLVDEAPAAWRARLIAAASDPSLQIALSAHPPIWTKEGQTDAAAEAVRQFLAGELPPGLGNSLRVELGNVRPGTTLAGGDDMTRMMNMPSMAAMPMMNMPSVAAMPMMDGSGMAGMAALRNLRAAVRLADGQWLAFAVGLPSAGFGLSWPLLIALAAMSVIIVPISIWAVRRVTAPLGRLAAAAERLGRDVAAPPLAEIGSAEMRQAAHAFNLMQARLRLLVENRTRMLAALSHDLRTPLTLLRLRVDDVAEVEERDRMAATIASMNEMIEATLAFARDEAKTEPRRRIDLAALVAAIVDDLADAGFAVTMAAAAPVILECQPTALRRALGNLLDNAVKYGGSADVALDIAATMVTITIADRGPGIPETELSRVFEPFYRLEKSRNRETGGTGLGLAIARAVFEAHGGAVSLANRAGGGLCARVSLPR